MWPLAFRKSESWVLCYFLSTLRTFQKLCFPMYVCLRITVSSTEELTLQMTPYYCSMILRALSTGVKKWRMLLNKSKCQVINLTHKQSLSHFLHRLGTSSLSVCPPHKYLDVHLVSNLSCDTHINSVTGDAFRTLGYIKLNLKTAPDHHRKLAYERYVRLKLE